MMMMSIETGGRAAVATEARSYFAGHDDGAERLERLGDVASMDVVVAYYRRAVDRRRVARETLDAYARGWRQAEAMAVRS